MKINNKIVNELITNIIGEDVLPLIDLIRGKKNVSEFKLAEQLNVTVNQVRNMLYRLSAENLVTFQRKKDKRKGWYIYYWTLNNNKVKEALVAFKKKQLSDFKARLEREQTSQFFFCPNGCMRMSMENAMDHDFKCQECGNLLKPLDNQRTIENIKQRIIELEEELSTPLKIDRETKEPKKKAKKKKVKKKPKKKKVKKKVTKKKVTKKKVKKKVAKKKPKKTVKRKVKKVKKKVAKKKPKKTVKRKVKKKVKRTPKPKSKIPKKKSKVSRLLKKVIGKKKR